METGSVRKIRTEPLAYTVLHDTRMLVALQLYSLIGESSAAKVLLRKRNYSGF